MSSGANAVGMELAFNTIGWKRSNILFAAVDALIGDPLISSAFGGQQPALTEASIVGSTIHATGNVAVTSCSTAQITAVVSNAATSAPGAIMGAGGMSVAMILASNMVLSAAHAFVWARRSARRPPDRRRRDRRGGGRGRDRRDVDDVLRGLAEQRRGQRHPQPARRLDPRRLRLHDELGFAARPVRRQGVADDYDGPDAGTDPDETAGRVFRYMGTEATIDLGAGLLGVRLLEAARRDEPDHRLRPVRRAVRARDGAEEGRSPGGSTSYFGLVDHNDLRSEVRAYIDGHACRRYWRRLGLRLRHRHPHRVRRQHRRAGRAPAR